MSEPLVSIVIPCFNTEKYVGEAIESALGQTYANKEVIVVDDGSTDGSLEVIRSFGEWVRWLTGTNGGAAAARNKGVAAARGEVLQFLDADDLLYPNKLERQVPLAVSHRPGMVFCDAEVVELESGRKLGRWGSSSIGTEDPVVYVLSSVLQTSAPLHWKSTFESVGGFREDTPPSDDPDLHLRLAMAGIKFHHLEETLVTLRRLAGSLSNRDPAFGLKQQRRIGCEAYERLLAEEELTEPRRQAFAGYFAGTARRALRQGLWDLAHSCFKLARTAHPDGGIPQAYSRGTRTMRCLLGSHVTERVATWKRALFGNHEVG